MARAVLISIRPKWAANIAEGCKTVEIRKTRPNLKPPFKCYIYCTQGGGKKDRIWVLNDEARKRYPGCTVVRSNLHCQNDTVAGNGRVIGEFVCDKIYEVAPLNHAPDDLEECSCLTREEIVQYLKGNGYAWHISNLKIYDSPKELAEFHALKKCRSCSKSGYESTACAYDENCMVPAVITKAPQSWCYVEELK